jgi:hypothetical protein
MRSTTQVADHSVLIFMETLPPQRHQDTSPQLPLFVNLRVLVSLWRDSTRYHSTTQLNFQAA